VLLTRLYRLSTNLRSYALDARSPLRRVLAARERGVAVAGRRKGDNLAEPVEVSMPACVQLGFILALMLGGGTARYDEIADFYHTAVGDDVSDSVAAKVFNLAGDVRGARVLDLACGQGRVSRELARRGASLVAADISGQLLEKARAVEETEALGIHYLQADATSPQALAGEEFDGVVCHFGLSDIDDLGAALATVTRVLRPGGWFVFSILHPCFPGWGDDAPSSWAPGSGYYTEGFWLANNTGFRGKIGSNHRMLSTYLNQLTEHGLALEQTAEPEPAGEWMDRNPGGDPVPVYLVIRCRKH
jgi:2-polyprenyl-3-methyl-5-hydroxy-6-metoxy-1,4-benzoquinol methylase